MILVWFQWTGDVFSGVGPIAISAAKKVKHVYANDLNPIAVEYLERNIVLNKLERKIEVWGFNQIAFMDHDYWLSRWSCIVNYDLFTHVQH